MGSILEMKEGLSFGYLYCMLIMNMLITHHLCEKSGDSVGKPNRWDWVVGPTILVGNTTPIILKTHQRVSKETRNG
jgi:hypothetical protein